MLRTRTQLLAAITCAVAFALTGCSDEASDTTSATSLPSLDDDQAYDRAVKIKPKMDAHDVDEPLPEGTAWATPAYIEKYNDGLATQHDNGLTLSGKVTTTATHPKDSNPDAAGGWDLTVYSCTTTTVRLHKDGRDVTADPRDPTKVLPKGPRDNVHILSFTSQDKGTTWQVDRSRMLSDEEAEKSPCAQ